MVAIQTKGWPTQPQSRVRIYLQHYPMLPSNFHQQHQLSLYLGSRCRIDNTPAVRVTFLMYLLFLYVLEFCFYSSLVEDPPSSSSSIHQLSPPPPPPVCGAPCSVHQPSPAPLGAPSRNSGADAVPLGRNPSTITPALGWGYKT